MFALFIATWIQAQVQNNLVRRVAACIEMNEFSCSDKDARKNADLVACFLRIPCEVEAIRKEFEKKTRIICPETTSTRKKVRTWNY